MKRIWYLSTCSTCSRIIKELGDTSSFEMIDIKQWGILRSDLDDLVALLRGTYDDFFSKRAMKYRAMGLQLKQLSQEEMAELITSEYTFLKRPVIQIGNKVFVGNSKKVVAAAIEINGQ
ncbi:MAG: ArsC/Spx/MgsR family protein [Saprospiraceae bacterium]